jgi:transposase
MSEKGDELNLAELNKDRLITIILELREMVRLQASEIQSLKDQLAKNSHNSGKPPSSDGLKKPRTSSLRERGKGSSGGQLGHTGHSLKSVEVPDVVVRYEVQYCPHCQMNLSHLPPSGVEKRQVFDVPPVRLEVTEHQACIKCCPGCGERVKAQFPDGVRQRVQYGTRLQGQMVYLSNYHLLPLQRTCEVFGAVYGHQPSQGAVLAAEQRLGAAVVGCVEQIKRQLQTSEVIHCDETGARVAGRLQWLHVASSPHLTLYGLHAKRSQVAMRALDILPHFRGWSVHDAFVSYWQFADCQHALCNAHHLRELRFLSEHYQQGWAEELAQVLLRMKHWLASGEDITDVCRQGLESDYDRLLAQGEALNPLLPTSGKRGRPKHTPAQNMLHRFQVYKDAILAFWRDRRVPFDNNLAERDLRMMKLQQKISGCFRTVAGAEGFCLIRSYISSARKQGVAVLDALSNALAGSPFFPAPMPE